MPNAIESAKSPVRAPTCLSCASLCYWFAISLLAWCALALIGLAWAPLHGGGAPALLFAGGIGCIVNWNRNRNYHCTITAPLFLAVGAAFLTLELGWVRISPNLLSVVLIAGVAAAFLLEWRSARPGARR